MFDNVKLYFILLFVCAILPLGIADIIKASKDSEKAVEIERLKGRIESLESQLTIATNLLNSVTQGVHQ